MKQLNPKATWLFFFRSLGIGLILFSLLGPLMIPFLFESLGFMGFVLIKPIIIILAPIWIFGAYFWARLSYNAYKFELTENAFKKEYGVIWKKYVSIPYGRIQNVNINRGLLMRILGLSSLVIQTAGYGGPRSGYLGFGRGAEGNLPGLAPGRAEQLRERLIDKSKGETGI